MRPKSAQTLPQGTNPEFVSGYAKIFHDVLDSGSNPAARGAEDSVSRKWSRNRGRQVPFIQSIVQDDARASGMVCDFSAGVGYYTRSLARAFGFVLHCDLSCDSLLYASRIAEKLAIPNIAFLRMDYLQPPFERALDCVICMDSLERGYGHDRLLLEAICRSLKPFGIAVVDFHNWWHNPLRRLGLLPQTFGLNRSYTRNQAEALLHSTDSKRFRYLPSQQEIEPACPVTALAKALLPATRHVLVFKNPNNAPPEGYSHSIDGPVAPGAEGALQ